MTPKSLSSPHPVLPSPPSWCRTACSLPGELCSFLRPCFSKCGFQTGSPSSWSPFTARISGPILCCAKSLQSCLTPCDLMDGSPPGSSVHGILQARTLEWVAMPSSRGSSHPRPTDWRSADEQDLKMIPKYIQF